MSSIRADSPFRQSTLIFTESSEFESDLLIKAQQVFKAFDKFDRGFITRQECIHALSKLDCVAMIKYLGNKRKFNWNYMVTKNLISKIQFQELIIKIKRMEEQEETEISEDFLITNFSLPEIQKFQKAWLKQDYLKSGYITIKCFKEAFEDVIKEYKVPNKICLTEKINNFICQKIVMQEEYVNCKEFISFISQLIFSQKYKYISKKSSCCFRN